MAYLVSYDANDREDLNYEFEGDSKDLTVDGLQDGGIVLRGATLDTCFRRSLRVPDELLRAVPQRMVIKPAEDGYIPDFAPAAKFSSHLVTGTFVDIIERLEPGVHQFIKIPQVVDTAGRPIGKEFFLMNILVRLKAVIPERSDVYFRDNSFEHEGKRVENQVMLFKMGLGRDPIITLRKDVITKQHVWRGTRKDLAECRFISDTLYQEISKAGLSAQRYQRCEEI